MNYKNKNSILSAFMKDKNVASIAPTAGRNVSKICDKIDFNKEMVIVEYGPGGGAFTSYLLAMLNNSSTLVVVEQNKSFYDHICAMNDSRVKAFNDRAENIKDILDKENINGVDYVISGIPLAFLKYQERERLVIDTYDILKNNGCFFVYQFSSISKKLLKKYFDNVVSGFLPLNIPPLFIFQAVKNGASVQ